MIRRTLYIFLILSAVSSNAQVFDVVIAADGSGDYNSLSQAFRSIPLNQEARTLIYIKSGVYKNKINFSNGYKNISIIGEDAEDVVFEWGDYNGDGSSSTSSSFTMQVEGPGFYVENMTISNTAGKVGQAVALNTTGNQQVFKNVRMLGFQDTYYAKDGVQYLQDCYIEGGTDFIFGASTAFFQDCEIVCVSGGQYITAPADTKLITTVDDQSFYHGLLFNECTIKSGDGVGSNSYYLGRPWQPNSSSVYINCTYEDQIKAIGWSTWNNENHLSGFYAEFKPVDPSGGAIDVSQRADWSHQLTQEQVDNNYSLSYFLDGWDPLPMVQALTVPQELTQDNAFVLSGGSAEAIQLVWSAVDGAIGYEVSRDGSTVGFSETADFKDIPESGSSFSYTVRSVAPSGALSDYSEALIAQRTITSIENNEKPDIRVYPEYIDFSSRVNIKIYSLSGQQVMSYQAVERVSISGLKSGVYILVATDMRGKVATVKIPVYY